MPASTRLTIGRIDHVLLLVSGIREAIDFYETVLGCDVESQLPRYGMAELRAGDSHIDLVDIAASQGAWALPPVAGGRNVDHVALEVESHDANALREHLKAHRIEIVEERIEEGSASLYVRDPSGNTVELIAASSRT